MTTARQQAAIALYSFAGGFADAASLLSAKTFTGHVTGNIVLLSIAIAEAEWHSIALHAASIGLFLLCTALGFRLASRPYPGAWLFCCQLLLLLCNLLTLPSRFLTLLFTASLSSSMGLQNGVVSSSLGVSLHSTFISGDLTSLIKRRVTQHQPGVTLLKEHQDARTRHILSLLTVSFVLGAFVAAYLYRVSPRLAPVELLIPLFIAMVLQPGSPRPE